jgi:hypothetical protein
MPPRPLLKDMAEAKTSIKRRTTPVKGKSNAAPLRDEPNEDWPEDLKTMYQREGVQMVRGGRVTKNIRARVRMVFESNYLDGVEPEQGLAKLSLGSRTLRDSIHSSLCSIGLADPRRTLHGRRYTVRMGTIGACRRGRNERSGS